MPTVVDASFVMAAILTEDHTPYAEEVLSLLAPEGLAAPALIVWEVANICAMKSRRGMLTDKEAQEGLGIFLSMPVNLDLQPEHLMDVVARAGRQGLTAYDAAYLELAARLNAPLATLDKALARAAVSEGLTVHSPFG